MNRYPFVLASLPRLQVGEPPELSTKEVLSLIELNVSGKDYEKIKGLLSFIDLENIKAFWLGLPLHVAGTLSAKDLEEALTVKDFLPSFVLEFLDRFESKEDRLRYFPLLYTSLYQNMEKKKERFLSQYYAMERQVRLVVTAFRAKQLHRDLVEELRFEDLSDPFVMEILVQADSDTFLAPKGFEPLQEIFEKASSQPLELHRALLAYRFAKILEMEEQYFPFSIDRILSFLARFFLVESWNALDRRKGLDFVDDLSKNG